MIANFLEGPKLERIFYLILTVMKMLYEHKYKFPIVVDDIYWNNNVRKAILNMFLERHVFTSI